MTSPDGNVISGDHRRWTAEEGITVLGGAGLYLEGLSFHGRVMVGNDSQTAAVIWDAANGVRNLKTVLENDYGLDLSGWTLYAANAVSYDGSVIVGNGINPTGQEEGWVAIIPPLDIITDSDGDGIADGIDNCPDLPNPNQEDRDGNRIGDACNEPEDTDGDEFADALDNCPNDANPSQANEDGDDLGDACDPFPTNPDNEQAQCDGDLAQCLAQGFTDQDSDGIPDSLDDCPSTPESTPVDQAGCSIDQFCAAVDATTRPGKRTCRRSDWQNDQPIMPVRERDCTVDRGALGPDDDRCVPAP